MHFVLIMALLSFPLAFAKDSDPAAGCDAMMSRLARPAPTFEVGGPYYKEHPVDGRTKTTYLKHAGGPFAELWSSDRRHGDKWVSERIDWRGSVGVRDVQRALLSIYENVPGARASSQLFIRNGDVIRNEPRPPGKILGWDQLRWFAFAAVRPTILPIAFEVTASSDQADLESVVVSTNLGDEDLPTVSVSFRRGALRRPEFARALNTLVRKSAFVAPHPHALGEPLIYDFYTQIDRFFSNDE